MYEGVLMYYKLISKRLLLKVLNKNYAHQVLDYYIRNKSFLEPWEPLHKPSFYTLSVQKELLSLELSKMKSHSCIRYWIFKKKDPTTIIGTISYSNIIKGCFSSCSLGYKLDNEETGKGYMKEALELTIPFVLKHYDLHRIEANIMPSNTPSLNLIKSFNFEEEGLAKKCLRINGRWEDHIRMALINDFICE